MNNFHRKIFLIFISHNYHLFSTWLFLNDLSSLLWLEVLVSKRTVGSRILPEKALGQENHKNSMPKEFSADE